MSELTKTLKSFSLIQIMHTNNVRKRLPSSSGLWQVSCDTPAFPQTSNIGSHLLSEVAFMRKALPSKHGPAFRNRLPGNLKTGLQREDCSRQNTLLCTWISQDTVKRSGGKSFQLLTCLVFETCFFFFFFACKRLSVYNMNAAGAYTLLFDFCIWFIACVSTFWTSTEI